MLVPSHTPMARLPLLIGPLACLAAHLADSAVLVTLVDLVDPVDPVDPAMVPTVAPVALATLVTLADLVGLPSRTRTREALLLAAVVEAVVVDQDHPLLPHPCTPGLPSLGPPSLIALPSRNCATPLISLTGCATLLHTWIPKASLGLLITPTCLTPLPMLRMMLA